MKRLRLPFVIFLFSAFFLLVQSGQAEKAFVTDTLSVTLRTGPSTEHRIMLSIPSGQLVEILESQEEWCRVRLIGHSQGDIEGWMLRRYLITREPWENRVNDLKKENAQLKMRLTDLEQQFAKTTRRNEKLLKELIEKTAVLDKVEKEYSSLREEAADYLNIKAEYEETQKELEQYRKSVQGLVEENRSLRDSQRNVFFSLGALIVFVSVVFGIVIGRHQKKRKTLLYS